MTLSRIAGSKEEPIAPRPRFVGGSVTVQRFTVHCTTTERVTVELCTPSLMFSRQGVSAFYALDRDGSGQLIVAEGNVTLLPNGIAMRALLTPGAHVLDFLSWAAGTVPTFDRFLQAWQQSRSGAQSVSIPASETVEGAVDRLDEACGHPFPQAEFELLALALSAVPVLTTTSSRIAIAPLATDLPETISDLVGQVRAQPANSWSLTEAAALAGYSSFHFSRMFKQIVGCGFHEFVDRCRTEVAVEKLTTSHRSLGAVSAEAGFPSLRAMRESIRDYLGLTVGELRGLSERAS